MPDSFIRYSVWASVEKRAPKSRVDKVNVYCCIEQVIPHEEGSPSLMLENPLQNTRLVMKVRLQPSAIKVDVIQNPWPDEHEKYRELIQEIAVVVLRSWLRNPAADGWKKLRKIAGKPKREWLYDVPQKVLDEMLEQNLTVQFQQ